MITFLLGMLTMIGLSIAAAVVFTAYIISSIPDEDEEAIEEDQ